MIECFVCSKEISKQKTTAIVLLFYVIFFICFIPSLVLMFFISKDTYEDPLEDGITFYNSTSYSPRDNIITNAPKINLNDKDIIDCNNIHELITVQNKSLGEIFKLNTGYIRYLSNSLIALKFVTLFFIIIELFNYIACQNKKDFGNVKGDNKVEDCCLSLCCMFFACMLGCLCMVFVAVGFFIFLIVDIILFSIMCSQYNNDETNKFLNFLQCDGINQDIITKFTGLNDLSSHFTAIKIVNSIYIVFFAMFGILMAFTNFTDYGKEGYKTEKEALNN